MLAPRPLVLAFLAIACSTPASSGQTTTPTPDPVASPDEAPAEVPDTAEPGFEALPRAEWAPPLLVWRETDADRLLGTIGPIDGPPIVSAAIGPGGGAVGQGSRSPVVSPDGRWVAYIAENSAPAMTSLTDGRVRAVPAAECAAEHMWNLLTAWTSDGSGVLFYSGPVDCEECTVPDACFGATGFYFWPVDAPPRRVAMTSIATSSERPDCFLGAAPDHIFEECLDGSTSRIRATESEVGQITRNGSLMAWLDGGTIMIGPVNHENGEDDVVVDGPFAQNQWPLVSSVQTIWQHRSNGSAFSWVVHAPQRTEIPIQGHGNARWYQDDVVFQDGQGVRRVSLTDGETTWLTRDRVHLIDVGTPR